tara:strand:+ start:509 stop:823 length:315 start_codon:yes stop_codon:yes gene_type:complete
LLIANAFEEFQNEAFEILEVETRKNFSAFLGYLRKNYFKSDGRFFWESFRITPICVTNQFFRIMDQVKVCKQIQQFFTILIWKTITPLDKNRFIITVGETNGQQ